MTDRHAVVIGAGIGGLTAAVALHRVGWHVTVLERGDIREPAGTGIALAPNALRALDTIGVGDAVRGMSAFEGEGGLRRPDGRWVSRTDAAAAAERFGGPVVIVHRTELVAMLAAELPATAVRTGVAAQLADSGGESAPARVDVPAGEETADLVVAADGIRSTSRTRLFPGQPGPEYAGFTSWRMVVPAPETPFPIHETWGRGLLWGTVPMRDGRGYAYATYATPAGGHSADGEQAELLRLFGDWHDPVPRIINAADPATILRHDVYALTTLPPAFHHGRVALLGDAAHAMTPNLGQGGCQAIEDAIVLAHHLRAATAADVPAALAVYTAERLPRTAEVVRRSRQISRLTMWSAPPAVAFRTAAFTLLDRLAPHLALRSLDGVADWRPPHA
jgi:2-polyprenyl-6-methoxyphenol hydroxylase-like FAD-dependent oxidoreductase